MADNVDEKKVEKVIQKLHAVFNKANLNPQEIIITYGNLGYHLGASLAGFQNTGPDIETLKKLYYADPTIDVGLMLQGLLITTWEQDFAKKPRLSKLAEHNKASEAAKTANEKGK
jgi:hypothetical protein